MKNFDDGSWTLPVGSLVIVDDADHLDPVLLHSLIEQAAIRTNTKLLLITNHDGVAHATDRGNAVTALQEHLPWARHLGTPEQRNTMRDSVISRAEPHLHAAGSLERAVHAEVGELLARHDQLARGYRDEVTARDRYITDIQQRNLSRDLGLSRDDGLEL